MLFSPSHRIAFAHYPKTAGCSVTTWFLQVFPDAVYVRPGFPHTPVADSLASLPARSGTVGGSRWMRASALARVVSTRHPVEPVRIIGILREPFEMLVSLYEYWRRTPVGSRHPFVRAAQQGSFAEFLAVGFRRHKIISYEDFFDVGGPMWPHTRLIAFDSLQTGLESVCRAFDIAATPHLERINASSCRQRDVRDYAAEAGPLYDRVRSHFAWYYEHGATLAAHGGVSDMPAVRRAA